MAFRKIFVFVGILDAVGHIIFILKYAYNLYVSDIKIGFKYAHDCGSNPFPASKYVHLNPLSAG